MLFIPFFEEWNTNTTEVAEVTQNYYSILHVAPFLFSQYNYISVDVYTHTGDITYFEHHSATERVTWPWVRLPGLLFRWWTAILLSNTSEHDSRSTDTCSRIYCLWHQFDISHTSWLCFVGHQRVSILRHTVHVLCPFSFLIRTVEKKTKHVRRTKWEWNRVRRFILQMRL